MTTKRKPTKKTTVKKPVKKTTKPKTKVVVRYVERKEKSPMQSANNAIGEAIPLVIGVGVLSALGHAFEHK